MSKTPKTDKLAKETTLEFEAAWAGTWTAGISDEWVPAAPIKAMEIAGTALHERLEHWISMNSGVCDPKDVEAIENWKKATQ